MTVETIVATAAEPAKSPAEHKDNEKNRQPTSPVPIVISVKAWVADLAAFYLITGIVMLAMITPEIRSVLAGIAVSVIVSQ